MVVPEKFYASILIQGLSFISKYLPYNEWREFAPDGASWQGPNVEVAAALLFERAAAGPGSSW